MDTLRAAPRGAALLLAATVLTAAAPPSPAASPLRGFVYTSYSRGGYSAPASAASLREVAAANVRVIELMSTWYVANSVNATAVAPAAQSPSDVPALDPSKALPLSLQLFGIELSQLK
jgi:hypothetical protein